MDNGLTTGFNPTATSQVKTCHCLSFVEQSSLIKQWYENQSGLQAMALAHAKELQKLKFVGEMKVLDREEKFVKA